MTAPERIYGWRDTQLDIARLYGGITFNGHKYEICPVTDDLVRVDILVWERKEKRHQEAERRKWEVLQQMELI